MSWPISAGPAGGAEAGSGRVRDGQAALIDVDQNSGFGGFGAQLTGTLMIDTVAVLVIDVIRTSSPPPTGPVALKVSLTLGICTVAPGVNGPGTL